MLFKKIFSGFFVLLLIFICFRDNAPQAKALTYSELISGSTINTNTGLESLVRQSFADIPVMIEIARCESGFRQYDSKGNPLYGGNGQVMGLYQINEQVHTATALGLGYDIKTPDGNIAYARHLYNRQGTDPWMAAFSCWNIPMTATAPTTSTVPVVSQNQPTTSSQTLLFTKDLAFGMTDPEILSLQKHLNSIGYLVARYGAGSMGQETSTFGSLTRNAIRRFQCDKNITCSGNEYTTGYGMLNAQTRNLLMVTQANTTATTTTTETPAFGLQRDLELGTSGTDVIYLQNFLQQRGLYSGTTSGNFDEATQNGVINFQKAYSIFPQHGYVGVKTKTKMKQLLGI